MATVNTGLKKLKNYTTKAIVNTMYMRNKIGSTVEFRSIDTYLH